MTDLEAIKEKWLKVCPVCDAGYPSTCCHPDEDYRPVILELVNLTQAQQDRIEQQDLDIQAQTRRLRFQHGRIARQELTIQEQGDKIRQLYDEVADLEGLIANYRGDDA